MTAATSAYPESEAATPAPPSSFAVALHGHHNSLGLLRLILAGLVLVDHAFPLGGFGDDPVIALTGGQASLGGIAVVGFFAISGYLIAKSGMSADIVQFLWRRVLRLFPAYWAVLVVAAVVVGPIAWAAGGDSLAEYFRLTPGGPVSYLIANWRLEVGTYGIYDIFATTTPYGLESGLSVFNGSLWTLIHEWRCYLIIGVLVVFGVLTRARIIVPLLALLMLAAEIVYTIDPDALLRLAPFLGGIETAERISLTFTFLVGSTIAVYGREVICDDRIGILSGVVFVSSLVVGGFATIGTVAFVYFLLYLAVRLPRLLQRVGARNDYSYGIYIYGFLVQQLLAFFGLYKLGYLPFLLIAAAITAVLAVASWHGIEKHALALKDWGPGRGIDYWWRRTSRLFGGRRRRSPEPASADEKGRDV